MVSLRLVVPMMLAAAIVAACFTYLIAPPSPVEAENRATPPASTYRAQDVAVPMRIDRLTNDEEKTVAAFERAADAILKRAANLQASATTGVPIVGKIPLPKKRPIPRP
jgi:hypothetical protein